MHHIDTEKHLRIKPVARQRASIRIYRTYIITKGKGTEKMAAFGQLFIAWLVIGIIGILFVH